MRIEVVFILSSPKRKPFYFLKNMCILAFSTKTIYAYCRYIYSDRKHCIKKSYIIKALKRKRSESF